MTGIYKITNVINGKFYIGSCISFYSRKHNHFSKLKKNNHPNHHLQASWNKYGADAFIIEMIANCPKEYCIKLEQWFIDNLNPDYNINTIAGSRLGMVHSEETKIKISDSRKGVVMSEEWKNAISQSNKGRIFPPELRDKLSAASKGRPKSDETRKKMGESKKGKPSPNKGKKFSEEHRKKLSETKRKYHESKKTSEL